MKIKYIGYYDTFDNNAEKRSIFLAGTNKMTYIASVLANMGSVKIISPAITTDAKCHRGKHKDILSNVSLKLFFTFGRSNLISRMASAAYRRISLLLYLMLHLNREDHVIVYHSLAYMNTIRFVHAVKRFNLTLEVEEIYGDVMQSPYTVKKEMNYFSIADSYIFPTELLDEKINLTHKPSSITYGTYQVEPDWQCKFNDGKIHVVYAGTFDPRKGGAAAAAAAEFLDERYHMHISGFGSEIDKQNLLNEIQRVSEKTKCTVTYDGLKSGEEYIRFIQSCDIGLSTQNPDAEFNATSFPSKILSYMANGLRVVSIRIPAIETSAIGKYMYYYNKQTPNEIANAILNVNLNDEYNSRIIIENLDKKFTEQLNEMIE